MYHQEYPPVPLCNRCNPTPFFGTLWHPHARHLGPLVGTPGDRHRNENHRAASPDTSTARWPASFACVAGAAKFCSPPNFSGCPFRRPGNPRSRSCTTSPVPVVYTCRQPLSPALLLSVASARAVCGSCTSASPCMQRPLTAWSSRCPTEGPPSETACVVTDNA